jgi:hypothetical protein
MLDVEACDLIFEDQRSPEISMTDSLSNMRQALYGSVDPDSMRFKPSRSAARSNSRIACICHEAAYTSRGFLMVVRAAEQHLQGGQKSVKKSVNNQSSVEEF